MKKFIDNLIKRGNLSRGMALFIYIYLIMRQCIAVYKIGYYKEKQREYEEISN